MPGFAVALVAAVLSFVGGVVQAAAGTAAGALPNWLTRHHFKLVQV